MTHLIRSSLALLVAALSLACGASRPRAATPGELSSVSVGSLAPVHALGDVYLAGQPSEADLAALGERGVRVVVNLRHAGEFKGFDEREQVEKLGMRYVNLPWSGPEQLTDEVFDANREVLNTTREPMLLHCASANRVGAVWIAWRTLDGGVDIEQAVAEAKRIGLKSQALEDKARSYIARRKP
jgi:uncharacterized protein (TIGR01244 family)